MLRCSIVPKIDEKEEKKQMKTTLDVVCITCQNLKPIGAELVGA